MCRLARILIVVIGVSSLSVRGDEPTRWAADRPVDSLHIRLDLTVDLEREHVEGTARLDLVALRDVSTITLDGVGLETRSVRLSRDAGRDKDVRFSNDGKHIELMLDEPLMTGQKCRVTIEYAVDHPESGLHFFSPSTNEPDVPYVVWSQGESTTNRYWFPCFDHPNERQTTEMVVTTKLAYAVSSNGTLLSRVEDQSAGTVTYHWLQNKPHASYLVSLIVGEFYEERETWRGKPVVYWAHPRYKDDVHRTFANTTRMLDFFSNKIGIEYPWDRYAQICCEGFGGGMENTSATTLGNSALRDERSSLDSDSDGLIAHELAHQWWGDLLTCRDWAHIWLNEGFASYFEALWVEEDKGSDEFQYNLYRKASRARLGGKKRPVVDRAYKSPDHMFDSRAYPKGAWILHMLRHRLGDDLFWAVLNRYGTEHQFKSVETVDLRKAVEQVTGRSFERFFHDWTARPGHPELTVSFSWLNDDRLAKVSIKQTQESEAFLFPLKIEFVFEGDLDARTMIREVTEKEETFYYPLPQAPTMVRVDPGQTVLMELKEKKGRDLWQAQLLHDADPIGRIRAAKHFGESASNSDQALLAEALQSETFWGVQREIASALAEAGGDFARDALIAGLSLAHPKARTACADELSSFHQDEAAIAAIRPLVERGDVSYSVEAAAIETFAELEPADAIEILRKVLDRDSRSERIRRAALSGLGYVRDASVIPLLVAWTKSDKPRLCRPAAIHALARATKQTPLDDTQMEPVVTALTSCLYDTGRRVRSAAIRALGQLSDPSQARPALTKLAAMEANDASGRVRSAAKRTIEAIKKGEPEELQLAELREDLKEALDKNEGLADRIEKLEAQLSIRDNASAKSKEIATAGADH